MTPEPEVHHPVHRTGHRWIDLAVPGERSRDRLTPARGALRRDARFVHVPGAAESSL